MNTYLVTLHTRDPLGLPIDRTYCVHTPNDAAHAVDLATATFDAAHAGHSARSYSLRQTTACACRPAAADRAEDLATTPPETLHA